MNYQDLGLPTPQKYFPNNDFAKLETSLTDAQKKSLMRSNQKYENTGKRSSSRKFKSSWISKWKKRFHVRGSSKTMKIKVQREIKTTRSRTDGWQIGKDPRPKERALRKGLEWLWADTLTNCIRYKLTLFITNQIAKFIEIQRGLSDQEVKNTVYILTMMLSSSVTSAHQQETTWSHTRVKTIECRFREPELGQRPNYFSSINTDLLKQSKRRYCLKK